LQVLSTSEFKKRKEQLSTYFFVLGANKRDFEKVQISVGLGWVRVTRVRLGLIKVRFDIVIGVIDM